MKKHHKTYGMQESGDSREMCSSTHAYVRKEESLKVMTKCSTWEVRKRTTE